MILDHNELKSAGQIWDLMMSGAAGWSFDDCPWVKIGNLYMSVTFTGDESWKPIVKSIAKSDKTVVIMTGRHGEQAGTAIDAKSGQIDAARTFETAHFVQDEERKGEFLRQNKDSTVKIDVVNLYTADASEHTVPNLKSRITTALGEGKVVILAWCYSLYCMRTFDTAAVPKMKDKHVALTIAGNDTPVKDIITADFGWVPK